MSEVEFRKFQKIPRWSRDIVITEKIDGTNGLVYISPDLEIVRAGSRSKWIYPGKEDNVGFATWVEKNKGFLLNLGPGYHYGEWWGHRINRGYGVSERYFSLFNTSRWGGLGVAKPDWEGKIYCRPVCCLTVPVLYEGPMSDQAVEGALNHLCGLGSQVVPGYMHPEGIVIYHLAGNYYFKKTLEDDEKPKSEVEAR